MVKVGFICEGQTEKIIIESKTFKDLLNQNNCAFIKAIDASGNGNLLPKNITPFISILKDEGADKIFILSDLDLDECITNTKGRINAPALITVIIAVKQIESWFLADSALLSELFDEPFEYRFPENENTPRETLRQIFVEKTGRGFGDSKPKFAFNMINKGFSITNASKHPHSPSAKYFVDKIISLKK